MKKVIVCIAPFGALLLAGCAGGVSYRPTVDPLTVADPAKYESDVRDCAVMSGLQWDEVAKSALIGGGIGAATGAAVGALSSGVSVAGGATAGAVLGIPVVGYSVWKANEDAKTAYRFCLRGRGYSVLR
jgi:hypothetical protein